MILADSRHQKEVRTSTQGLLLAPGVPSNAQEAVIYYQVHCKMGKARSERCGDLPKVTQLGSSSVWISLHFFLSPQYPAS